MVGLDTGFFIAMMKGDQRAADTWSDLLASDSLPLVSVITLGELLYIAFRTGKPELGTAMVENIALSTRVVNVDRSIVEKAASLKAGRAIPYRDAIILSTFLLSGCRTIHTTDRNHFGKVKNRKVKFVFY